MKRRGFIKNSCTLCLAAATVGFMQSIESCSPLDLYRTEAIDKKMNVPLALFADKDALITRIKGEEFDVAVLKGKDQHFDAFELRCTHADNAVTFTGKNFLCNLHGSTYGKDGNVTKGPAEQKLKSFRTEISNENLIVYL